MYVKQLLLRCAVENGCAGQDESRRRGTIQPHMTSVMAQDRRSGTLQLLSQGAPFRTKCYRTSA